MQFGADNSKCSMYDKFERNQVIESVIRKYSDMIFRIAYNYLGNSHDAQDVLQEVAVTLVVHGAPFDEPKHLKYWLCRVTLNKCKNFKKSAEIRLCEPLSDEIPVAYDAGSELIDTLMKLPVDYRNVLYLYYYEEMKIEEISKALKKNPNTIGSQLRRARKKLEKLLIEGGYVND